MYRYATVEESKEFLTQIPHQAQKQKTAPRSTGKSQASEATPLPSPSQCFTPTTDRVQNAPTPAPAPPLPRVKTKEEQLPGEQPCLVPLTQIP